jgi:hypothetical protein
MKLERLHEYVLPVAATLAGMGIAVYCGKLSGNGQLGTLAFIIAISVTTTLLLLLRQNIWLLIPAGWVLYGQVPVLPLPFSIRDLTVMTVFVCFLVLKALKIVRIKPPVGLLDLIMFALLVYIVTVFLRNPVGVNALGSERVGGRPYFDIVIGLLAYWVLSRAHADLLLAPKLPFFVLTTQLFEMSLNMLAFHVPKTAPFLTTIYNGVDPSQYEAQDVYNRVPGAPTSGRQSYLLAFGQSLALICCSFWRPLTLITPIYWARFVIFAFSLVFVGLSGFRSGLLTIAGFVVISSIIRRGKTEVIPMALFGAAAMGIVLLLHGTVIDLPLSIQRTLSFLPGRWDPIAVRDAKDSTAWRLAIWKMMLTESQFVESKWFGDGFGFSQRQLAVMRSQRVYGEMTLDDVATVGSVHSGPLSTIRYAGYFGLALYVIFIVGIAVKAWNIAQRSKDTPYFSVALFVCVPLVLHPFIYIFVVGGFEGALPASMFGLGMLKMLHNSIQSGDIERRPKLPSRSEHQQVEANRELAHV